MPKQQIKTTPGALPARAYPQGLLDIESDTFAFVGKD
jgi:hypothetical protein